MSEKINVIELQNLELKLGYSFQNLSLLNQALTHRSFGSIHNERLEYLGDSILGMIIAKDLYDRFPKCPEGDLTRMRSTLVRETTLAQLAREFGIGNCLRLGPGELKTGGFRRDSLIADAVESIIGAMFIDTNEDFPRVRQVVLSWFASRLQTIKPDVNQKITNQLCRNCCSQCINHCQSIKLKQSKALTMIRSLWYQQPLMVFLYRPVKVLLVEEQNRKQLVLC